MLSTLTQTRNVKTLSVIHTFYDTLSTFRTFQMEIKLAHTIDVFSFFVSVNMTSDTNTNHSHISRTVRYLRIILFVLFFVNFYLLLCLFKLV